MGSHDLGLTLLPLLSSSSCSSPAIHKKSLSQILHDNVVAMPYIRHSSTLNLHYICLAHHLPNKWVLDAVL